MRDAPSIVLVNIIIDFNLSSHIIRQKSSHVSGLGPIQQYRCFHFLRTTDITLSSNKFI